MKPEAWATGVRTMTHDLAVIRWQLEMAKSPQKDPAAAWTRCDNYWKDPKQLDKVYQLVLYLGSLWYPDPKSLEFTFKMSMDDAADRAHEAANEQRRSLDRKKSRAGKKTKSKRSTSKKSTSKKSTKKKSKTRKKKKKAA